MGIEHFISIIDRAGIDKVLALSWKDFNRRYPGRNTSRPFSAQELVREELDCDQPTVDDIMKRRTLRWTMNRCSPKLLFMYEIIEQVPHLRTRCRSYTPGELNDLAIVHAVGAEAFVRGKITQATLFSILRFCARLSLDDAIALKNPRYKKVVKALKSWIPSMPPFRWLPLDYFGDGYACLNLRETKSVVRFLERAWEGNWPANLSDWVRGELDISSAGEPTIRDSDAARQVLRWFHSPKSRGMSLVSYVEV